MYMLKSLGDESTNKKIFIRLKKRIKNDIMKIREVNSLNDYTIIIENNELMFRSLAGEQFRLVKSNEWIKCKNLSENYLKMNLKKLLV